jgi:hypothetical protein
MTTWSWAWFVDRQQVRSPSFSSRQQAEEWMGQEWESLLASGATSASLEEDGRVVYEMGLSAE